MVSGYPTSTNLPRVDGLSTDPRDLGCHKDKGRLYVMTEENYVATQHSESTIKYKKFYVRQTQLKVEVNFVATKTAIVVTEFEKNYKKKNVATHKLILQHNKELKAEISVVTKEYYIATIKVVD